MDRRGFIGKTVQGGAAAACAGLAWHGLLAQQARAAAPLRPPGAVADFAARCVRCGQCVQACPYDTLHLAPFGGRGGAGMPTLEPRQTPCFMCESVPCARACPSGALDRLLPDIAQARIGLAVIDAEHCLSWQGLRCEVCFRACPLSGKALTLAPQPRQTSRHAIFVPMVHSTACTGCGLCEKRCPTEQAAIRVLDPAAVQGRIGAHYRLQTDNPHATDEPAPTAPAEPAAAGNGAIDYLNRPRTP